MSKNNSTDDVSDIIVPIISLLKGEIKPKTFKSRINKHSQTRVKNLFRDVLPKFNANLREKFTNEFIQCFFKSDKLQKTELSRFVKHKDFWKLVGDFHKDVYSRKMSSNDAIKFFEKKLNLHPLEPKSKPKDQYELLRKKYFPNIESTGKRVVYIDADEEELLLFFVDPYDNFNKKEFEYHVRKNTQITAIDIERGITKEKLFQIILHLASFNKETSIDFVLGYLLDLNLEPLDVIETFLGEYIDDIKFTEENIKDIKLLLKSTKEDGLLSEEKEESISNKQQKLKSFLKEIKEIGKAELEIKKLWTIMENINRIRGFLLEEIELEKKRIKEKKRLKSKIEFEKWQQEEERKAFLRNSEWFLDLLYIYLKYFDKRRIDSRLLKFILEDKDTLLANFEIKHLKGYFLNLIEDGGLEDGRLETFYFYLLERIERKLNDYCYSLVPHTIIEILEEVEVEKWNKLVTIFFKEPETLTQLVFPREYFDFSVEELLNLVYHKISDSELKCAILSAIWDGELIFHYTEENDFPDWLYTSIVDELDSDDDRTQCFAAQTLKNWLYFYLENYDNDKYNEEIRRGLEIVGIYENEINLPALNEKIETILEEDQCQEFLENPPQFRSKHSVQTQDSDITKRLSNKLEELKKLKADEMLERTVFEGKGYIKEKLKEIANLLNSKT